MRRAEVYRNDLLAGVLTESTDGSYTFHYDAHYLMDNTNPSISLNLPRQKELHSSEYLFPLFSNMLSEGANRALQHRHYQISDGDEFGLLLATSSEDNIGAVWVKAL